MDKQKNVSNKDKVPKLYECTVKYFDETICNDVVAETRSKARYKFFRMHFDDTPFSEIVKHIKTRSLGKSATPFIHGDREKFNRVKEYRGLHFATQGMTVDVDGVRGTIFGGNDSSNFDVLFLGDDRVHNCHPTWETTYYDSDGNIIHDFKKRGHND